MNEREKRGFSVTTETIWSEGSRLAADIYVPEGKGPHPAILICTGWGGTRAGLEPICRFFSQYGYLTLACDYRGWGGSDGKIIPLADTKPLLEAGEHELRVRVLREIADPYDQATDLHNCLGYHLH